MIDDSGFDSHLGQEISVLHFTTKVRKTLNCFLRVCIWKYTNMNPTAPSLHATTKLHEPNTPIRPIINWKNAPACELAKQLAKTLHNYLNLPYTYNVRNSNHIMVDLKTTELNNDTRICSFHIENMYTNIPRKDIINIINNVLQNNTEIQLNIRNDIIYILKIVMEQNYLKFGQQCYKQAEGLAVGTPTSGILVETFIQHVEHKHIYPILKTQEIITCYRYVDNIIYDQNKTNIKQTLNEFNNIQPFIKFTIEKEQHEEINYFNITIHRKDKGLEFSIHRKPTQTDIIIPNSSCHPYEHKLSGIKYLLNRLHTYPITKKLKQTEKTYYRKTNIT
jgi:hypothetical protein